MLGGVSCVSVRGGTISSNSLLCFGRIALFDGLTSIQLVVSTLFFLGEGEVSTLLHVGLGQGRLTEGMYPIRVLVIRQNRRICAALLDVHRSSLPCTQATRHRTRCCPERQPVRTQSHSHARANFHPRANNWCVAAMQALTRDRSGLAQTLPAPVRSLRFQYIIQALSSLYTGT